MGADPAFSMFSKNFERDSSTGVHSQQEYSGVREGCKVACEIPASLEDTADALSLGKRDSTSPRSHLGHTQEPALVRQP